jgi:ABC-type antimicrobial peptide transport system permease subunit
VTAIRQYLGTVPGFTGFSDLPEIRASGDWPGKSTFTKITNILYVVTLLALLGALVLLPSTMTTLIGEQTNEIATMKAIGAGRKQIRHVYLRTATLLGGLGAVVGAALGVGGAASQPLCIGAHARDVRRIFATEGLTVALGGWLIGIPLGLALAHAVVTLAENVFNEHVLFAFPALNIPIALVGTVVLALVVMLIPLRRAVAFKPGDALRYT